MNMGQEKILEALDRLDDAMDQHPGAANKPERDVFYKLMRDAAFSGPFHELQDALPKALDLPEPIREALGTFLDAACNVVFDLMWWRYAKERLACELKVDTEQVDDAMIKEGMSVALDTWGPGQYDWADEVNLDDAIEEHAARYKAKCRRIKLAGGKA